MKKRTSGILALITIGIFSVLFQSCGGGKISDSTTKADVAAARTGYVEGYIYTTATAAQKHRAASAGADSYVPFSTATVKVACGSVVKTGATDADGYYKIEKTPVGDCTLTATKAGYTSVEKQVTVAENEGTKASYTTDGLLLGRVLLEDKTIHTGTTVKITYGDQIKTVETDAKGFYALPDVSGANANNVLIEATNSCAYYLPASTTVQMGVNSGILQTIPTITMPQLFRFTVSADKSEYRYGGHSTTTFVVEYRGTESIKLTSNVPNPFFSAWDLTSNEIRTIGSPMQVMETLEFSKTNNKLSYVHHGYICCYMGDMDTGLYMNEGYYEIHMSIGGTIAIPGYDCAQKFGPPGKAGFLSQGVKIQVTK